MFLGRLTPQRNCPGSTPVDVGWLLVPFLLLSLPSQSRDEVKEKETDWKGEEKEGRGGRGGSVGRGSEGCGAQQQNEGEHDDGTQRTTIRMSEMTIAVGVQY